MEVETTHREPQANVVLTSKKAWKYSVPFENKPPFGVASERGEEFSFISS